ncbi:GIY-YIG nuclease family protein [Azospirillum argentinense]|uniref:Bacteriophage T5 Orf172 DNA-binding domain-containing protein n=1 Tax=Azospirillum argentinense TaxID=2970906 RepID=A0A5B0KYZ3_9PROT|nr:GIY-YIG nuclease family protein [Azospirillum argentinense]KAA1057171.1 hypothetical protein FH063_001339 [Azospirillum argentinense]
MGKKTSVYVIAGDTGPVKIGVSINPKNRLSSVQNGHPHKLALRHVVPVAEAYRIEGAVHAALADKRLNGEWFDVTADEARSAIDHAIETLKPNRVERRKSGGTDLWILISRLGLTMEMFADLCGMPVDKVKALCRDDVVPPPWAHAILKLYAMLPAEKKAKVFAERLNPAVNENGTALQGKPVSRFKWAKP